MSIIWYITTLGCAFLFYGIGIYASKCTKPMGFWSGVEIKESEISDIQEYNKENSSMWKIYSLWYFAAALAGIWSTVVAVIFLISSCTIGLVLLILTYNKICKKYKKQ